MAAQETRQPVFAVEEDLRRRWPVFTELLFGTPRTAPSWPCRCSRHWPGPARSTSTSSRPDEVPRLDVFEALAVGELVTSALSDAAVWSTWTPTEGPDWLHGPVPQRRAAVWEAMGKVSVDLEVGAPTSLGLLRAAPTAPAGPSTTSPPTCSPAACARPICARPTVSPRVSR